jgi:hypothetical protein
VCVCVCVCVSHRTVSAKKASRCLLQNSELHNVLQVKVTVKRLREINLNLLTVTCFDKAPYSLLHNTRNLV